MSLQRALNWYIDKSPNVYFVGRSWFLMTWGKLQNSRWSESLEMNKSVIVIPVRCSSQQFNENISMEIRFIRTNFYKVQDVI